MMAEYIEREALLKHFQFRIPVRTEISKAYKECVDLGRKLIKEIPTADVVEVRHGEWVESVNKFGLGQSNCSICGGYMDGYVHYPYCPYCGAKLGEVYIHEKKKNIVPYDKSEEC